MKITKILSILTLLLTIGLSQSIGQSTIGGYYQLTIPAGGLQPIANQLVRGSDSLQTNNDINTVLGYGCVSDPAGPPSGSNTVLQYWNNGFSTYYYFNAADATIWNGVVSLAGWYNASGDYASLSLNPGQGSFIKNNFSSPITLIFWGRVFSQTNIITIVNSNNIIALQEPTITNVLNSQIGLPPLTSDKNGPPNGSNDIVGIWNGSSYDNYYYFNKSDATNWTGKTTNTSGLYTSGKTFTLISPTVGQAFLLIHHGASITWTNKFYNADWTASVSNANLLYFNYFPTNIGGTNYIVHSMLLTNIVPNTKRYDSYVQQDAIVLNAGLLSAPQDWIIGIISTSGPANTMNISYQFPIGSYYTIHNLFWRTIRYSP